MPRKCRGEQILCPKYCWITPISPHGTSCHCDVLKIQQAGRLGRGLYYSEKKIRCCVEEERLKKAKDYQACSLQPNNPAFWVFYLLQTVFISFRLTNMACGATLKRSMEFEALLSPQSPKRRRCNPLPGTPSTPSPQRCNLRPPVDSPTHSMSPSAIGGEHRLTPGMELRRIFSFSLRLGWVLWGRGFGWSGMDS